MHMSGCDGVLHSYSITHGPISASPCPWEIDIPVSGKNTHTKELAEQNPRCATRLSRAFSVFSQWFFGTSEGSWRFRIGQMPRDAL